MTASALKKAIPTLDAKRFDRALSYMRERYGDRPFELLSDVSLEESALASTAFLSEFCRDDDALIASLLQHALRVPEASLEDIGKNFGRPVRDLVSRVHLLSHLYTTDWKRSVDDMKLMLVSVSDDVRVLLITLSSICMLLEDTSSITPEYRTRICRQALQLFAPVAARLGIYALKYRLERFAFEECYPTDAERIEQQLSFLHDESGGFLPKTAHAVFEFLRSEKIDAEVMAREKQPYSIFQKMRTKSVTALEKINDLFAVRVIVPKVEDCYQVLGLLHRLGTPISSRFKDYISFPKPNGYKSLHTCIIGLPHAPRDAMVELQIRTREMHQEAEYGVAAHWMYKEKGPRGKVMASAERLELSDVLLEQTVGEQTGGPAAPALVDHIFTLTPHGDIIELPEGGTPLDFAFAVHTDLGLAFKAARINGNIAPVSAKLENGDVVEIIAGKSPQPSMQWMKILATSSARSKLKSYFLGKNRGTHLARGRTLMNKELKLRSLPPLDPDLGLLSSVDGRGLTVKEREDLLVKIGMDMLKPSTVLRGLPQEKRGTAREEKRKKTIIPMKPSAIVRVIGESITLPFRFAKCCAPDQKTEIIGIPNRSGYIVVHGRTCKVIRNVSGSRKLPMEWVETKAR